MAVKQAKNEMVEIRLRRERGRGKGVYVSVNTERYFIPYGQTVQVPACIAEVLENSAAQDEQTRAMIEELTRSGEF